MDTNGHLCINNIKNKFILISDAFKACWFPPYSLKTIERNLGTPLKPRFQIARLLRVSFPISFSFLFSFFTFLNNYSILTSFSFCKFFPCQFPYIGFECLAIYCFQSFDT